MEMLKLGQWLDRHRLDISVRTALAVGGGYLLSALLAAVLSVLLPMARAEAVMVATMLSYLAYVALIIWAYATRRLWRLAGIWVVLALAAWLALVLGGQT